jgi:cation transport ATPase
LAAAKEEKIVAETHHMRKLWILAVVVFACAYAVEMVLERMFLVDSIGWWYTALVAAVYTAIVMALAVFTRSLWRAIRRRQS